MRDGRRDRDLGVCRLNTFVHPRNCGKQSGVGGRKVWRENSIKVAPFGQPRDWPGKDILPGAKS